MTTRRLPSSVAVIDAVPVTPLSLDSCSCASTLVSALAGGPPQDTQPTRMSTTRVYRTIRTSSFDLSDTGPPE